MRADGFGVLTGVCSSLRIGSGRLAQSLRASKTALLVVYLAFISDKLMTKDFEHTAG